MSIILDALRKSEAARRRHQAPELFAEMPDRAPAPRAHARWPMRATAGIAALGIAALGIGALAFALWLTTRTTTPSSTAPSTAQAQTTPGAETVDVAGIDSASVATNADPTRDIGAAPNRSDTRAPPFEAPNGSSASQIPMPPTQAGRAPAVVPPPADDAARTVDAPVAAALPPTPRASPAPAQTSATTTSREAPAAAPAADTAQPAFRSPGNDAPMALGDLDAETRKQLPPLKLSMHMWHDEPARRFVILDGQRLREGDVIGDVVVRRITRDGATLSWRGTALKIEWR